MGLNLGHMLAWMVNCNHESLPTRVIMWNFIKTQLFADES